MLEGLSPRELITALGDPKPPKGVWQEPFDHIRGHCERIVERRSVSNAGDLIDYFLDYKYTLVQIDLFHFVLPIALEAWANTLLNTSQSLEDGVSPFEGMWQAFEDRPPHPDYLSADQYTALNDYFQRVMLLRMSQENMLKFTDSRASSYEWISQFATLTYLFPVSENIWKEWWKLEHEWQAICGLQWWSGLLYERNDSPIFGPYTAERGGGNSYPFQTEHLKYKSANEENVSFFKNTLTLDYAEDCVRRACHRLKDTEFAQLGERIASDLDYQLLILMERMPKFLSLLQMEYGWSFTRWDDIPA